MTWGQLFQQKVSKKSKNRLGGTYWVSDQGSTGFGISDPTPVPDFLSRLRDPPYLHVIELPNIEIIYNTFFHELQQIAAFTIFAHSQPTP